MWLNPGRYSGLLWKRSGAEADLSPSPAPAHQLAHPLKRLRLAGARRGEPRSLSSAGVPVTNRCSDGRCGGRARKLRPYDTAAGRLDDRIELQRGSRELAVAPPPLHPVRAESPAGDGAGARWERGVGGGAYRSPRSRLMSTALAHHRTAADHATPGGTDLRAESATQHRWVRGNHLDVVQLLPGGEVHERRRDPFD